MNVCMQRCGGNDVGALGIEIVRMSFAPMMSRKLCCVKDTFQLVLVLVGPHR